MNRKQAEKILIEVARTRLKRLAFNHNLYKLYGVLGVKGEYEEYERLKEAIKIIKEQQWL